MLLVELTQARPPQYIVFRLVKQLATRCTVGEYLCIASCYTFYVLSCGIKFSVLTWLILGYIYRNSLQVLQFLQTEMHQMKSFQI